MIAFCLRAYITYGDAPSPRLPRCLRSSLRLRPLLAPKTFVDDGYIGLGVPIGTDAFVQHFVKKKCQDIMDDVDKLDNIQDGFIHYQLVRIRQATPPSVPQRAD